MLVFGILTRTANVSKLHEFIDKTYRICFKVVGECQKPLQNNCSKKGVNKNFGISGGQSTRLEKDLSCFLFQLYLNNELWKANLKPTIYVKHYSMFFHSSSHWLQLSRPWPHGTWRHRLTETQETLFWQRNLFSFSNFGLYVIPVVHWSHLRIMTAIATNRRKNLNGRQTCNGRLYSSLAASINMINTQEHHQKNNVELGHRKTRRLLSLQGVSKVVYFGGHYDYNP